MSRQPMRFEYHRQLILRACDGSKVAAEILNYFLGCFQIQHKKFQNAPLEADCFTFKRSASELARKTFYQSTKSIRRGLDILKQRELIFAHKPAHSLNQTISYRINFARLEAWKDEESLPLLSQMSTSIGSGCPHADGQDDHMDRVNVTTCKESGCPPVYSISTTSKIHSSSMGAAADPSLSDQKKAVNRLVSEVGFSDHLAEALVVEHGADVAHLALNELRGRSTPPKNPVGFVRAIMTKPLECNAKPTAEGWIMPTPIDPKSVALLEEAKRRIKMRWGQGQDNNRIFSELSMEIRDDAVLRQAFMELKPVTA